MGPLVIENIEGVFMKIRLLLIATVIVVQMAVPGCGNKSDKPVATPAEAEQAAPAKSTTETPAGNKAPENAANPTEAEKPATDKTEVTTPAGDDNSIPDVVATVNGVDIKSAEFQAELEKITARGAKIPKERMLRIQQNIMKRIIEKELVKQAIKQAAIKTDEEEIAVAFTEYKSRFQNEEQFQNYLKHGRVSEDSVKGRILEKKSLEKLIEARGNLDVSATEAKEFYDKNERFYMEKAGLKARHILIKLAENASKEDEEAAIMKIKDVQRELKKGVSFEEMAKKKSEGPSAPKGGDLGFFGKGQMVKAFEEAAFNLPVGEVSKPVRTRFGFHLILVQEKRDERKKPFGEVKDQIVESIKNKKFFQERRLLLKELENNAKIEKFIEEPSRESNGKDAGIRDENNTGRPIEGVNTPKAIRPAKPVEKAPKPDARPKANIPPAE